MSLLGLPLLGLPAAASTGLILPRRQSDGWFATVVLGVAGASLGGWSRIALFDTKRSSLFFLTSLAPGAKNRSRVLA